MSLAKDYNGQSVQSDTYTVNSLIHEFIFQLKVKSEKTIAFYVNALVDFYIYWGKEWNELSVAQYQGYLDYLKRVNTYKDLSQSNLNKKVKVISQYLSYLQNRDIISSECITPFKEYQENQVTLLIKKPKVKKENKTKDKMLSEIISEFLLFLKNNDYYDVNKYKKCITIFERFLESNGKNIKIFSEDNQEKFLFEQIGQYEKLLSSRVSREEIALSTATIYLRAVQLFVKYLSSKNLVNKKYTIPLYLRGRSKRANEYVPKERTIELINSIYEHSNHVLRDLSIFLIIVDTGCRPIEVCNLTLNDVDKVERTLSFECGKTEKRKVKISHEVMEVLKDYLTTRSVYSPKTETLFLSYIGNPITPGGINTIFYLANLKVYGESLYPAKAFRHTYLTNALEEHSFERVSKAIGHKDWKSTYYYYNRSNKRLLTNTLSKSPLQEKRD